MKSKSLMFLIACLVIITSCKKKETDPGIEYGTGKVNFSDLKVGQKNTYYSFFGNCADSTGLFEQFFNDTLFLEVIDMRNEVFTFSEKLTEGSNRFQPSLSQGIHYEVIQKDGYVLIPQRDSSALFYFYANDTLQLEPPNIIELFQETCYLMTLDSNFIGNEIGLIKEFQVFGKTLSEKIAVSCVPPFLLSIEDGYLLYDKNGLGVSYTISSSSDPNFSTFTKLGWIEINELN